VSAASELPLAVHRRFMVRALELAARGQGYVEPNPMVGCVIVRDGRIVGEGWHARFGGPHAEIEALRAAGDRARGATLYVTLEPCCHTGKTPPCTESVIQAGPACVVVGIRDPFPQVSGGGIAQLEQAGIPVAVGMLEDQIQSLCAPYSKLVRRGRPWVIAKWAMTLDGKIATAAGDSRWISNEASRRVVHRLRARMDGIIVGAGTARADDPQLTARLGEEPVPRVATRIVLDSAASLASESRLVQTAREAPVLVVIGQHAPEERRQSLERAGCEILALSEVEREQRLLALLSELGRRRMTNVLVEGGSQLLGACFDAECVDEVHAFIAPRIAGGEEALTAVGGCGVREIADAWRVASPEIELLDGDVYLHGIVGTETPESESDADSPDSR